ncbi:HNH endonuclease signature motif containing protein [Paeniglutamicibacter sp. NPDC091659]|uniref:HNH endonuclease signature motif containing protein n=1 Tax=Paeniglutamicibacter sp. NPDC091659 TaxID=3364389 RepID=UPI003800A499
MNTEQFVDLLAKERGESASPGRPGPPRSRADRVRALLAAEELFVGLATDIAADHGSPTIAALLGMVIERAHRRIGFSQILAADAARSTLAHELPIETLNQLRGIVTDPKGFLAGTEALPEDPRSVPSGRPPHKDTPDFLQKSLGISFFEARDRVQAADVLLPHTDINGIREPVRYPGIAGALCNGRLGAREAVRGAKKLDRLRPAIFRQPHAARLAAEVEAQILDSMLTQNEQATNKLFDTIEQNLTQVREAEPGDEEIRAKTGIFLTRRTTHFTYLSICVRNVDAELFFSHFALSDNPRTNAGNRRALADDARSAEPGSTIAEENGSWTGSSGGAEADAGTTSDQDRSPRIPEWAVAPGTPVEERPVAAYTDLGKAIPRRGTQSSDPVPGTAPTGDHTGDNGEFPPGGLNSTSPGDDGLTPAMRHLQTLLNIMRSAGGANQPGKTGLPRSTMVVYCQLTTLLGLAGDAGLTQHGVPVSPGDLRRALCEAEVIPMVLNGQSQILDLGRAERYFPDYMRQAILARDGGCIVPGCTVPPEHCEIHHLKPWSEGGLTRVKDGAPHCSSHHHAVHTSQIKDVLNDDGLPAVILPEYIDPEQKPRRNSYWGQQAQTQRPLF